MARKQATFTLDEELIKRLREYSDSTMIPQARIVEQAVIKYLDEKGSTK